MAKKIVVAALSAVIALNIAAPASAKEHMMKGMEKCYGIAKAGKNSCGSSTEACAGKSTVAGAKNAWIAVPKGTCSKIVGGSLTENSSSK